ncbi:MAG: hypothetical protein JXB17_02770, partial [Bacteroidales bacterium]|nr:hypothetical protein [Bacteroidales bacterium]
MTEPTIIGDIDIQKETKPQFNPFPGLRPFGINESHLFFGREGQSEEVLKHLSKHRFIAVIGASGSGKSSLMYCGVVPILYGGFITSAGSKWRVITTRPGNDPINNLGNALVENEKKYNISEEDFFINTNITQTILRTSSLGLVEAVKLLNTPKDENILLLVDQFEELFRYKQSRKQDSTFNESESFVKLLVEAVTQKEVPIYIILTMRSDFIGDCSQFQELTELINLSNYLVPQMTRDNFREAILGPVAVGGGSIDSNLVQQLLNDIGDNPDQLPILQHSLMRTWDHWIKQGNTGIPISIEDYEAIGKMEKALSEHANEAFDELSPNGKEICGTLFKTLTERGADNRGVRRPSRIAEVAEITQSNTDEVIEVVNTFRKAGRSFLTPSYEIPLNPESVVDISHESLMRIWDKLKTWVEEEANSVQMYKRLAEAAELYQLGKTTLWRPPDLHLAISWQNKQKPTLAWGQRYNPAFERTIVFLETSEKDFRAEEQNKLKLQKRALQRTRMFAIVLGSAAIIALGLTLYSFTQTREAKKQRAIAEKQTEEAKKQQQIAIEEREKAQEQEQIAKEEKAKAVEQEQIAKEEKAKAVEQEQIAKEQEKIAKKQEKIAKDQEKIAKDQTKIAEEQTEVATEEKAKAEKLRMLSISQSMAVKAQQIQDMPELTVLLAYQAFLFNEKFGGESHNADVYKGLYVATKVFSKPDYNVYPSHTDAVKSLVFHPKQNIFYSAGGEGMVYKWKVGDTTNAGTQIYKNFTICRSVSINPEGNLLAVAPGTRQIQIFDLAKDAQEPVLLEKHKGVVTNLKFLNNSNQLVSIGADTTIYIWNIEQKKPRFLNTTRGEVKSLDISDDDKYVVIATENGLVLLFNISDGALIKEIYNNQENTIYGVSFNKNMQIAFGDKFGTIHIYDFNSSKFISNFTAHNARINDIKYSP